MNLGWILGVIVVAVAVIKISEVWTKDQVRRQWLTTVVIILGVLTLLIEFMVRSASQKAEHSATTQSGELQSWGAKIIADSISVLVGTSEFVFKGDFIRGGNPIRLDLMLPIEATLKLTERGVLVSGEFFSWDGKVAARLVDNQWQTNPNALFDRNYNDHSLEVIDNEGVPVLQVEQVDHSTIRVSGVFVRPDGTASVFSSARWDANVPKDELAAFVHDRARRDSVGLGYWFHYPSRSHLGERVGAE